jgi:hypothetical protein
MSGRKLDYWTIVEVLLRGKSWWKIIENGIGEPAELWPLVGKIEPIIDARAFIKGWKQTVPAHILPDGTMSESWTMTHSLESVVWFRTLDPNNIFGGLGRIQAASSGLRMEEQIDESEWSAFKQGIFPETILLVNNRDPDRRREIREEVMARFAGARHAGQPLVIPGAEVGGADVKFPPTRGAREMGYRDGAERTRDKILGVMRAPKLLLGLADHSNRASAEAEEYTFSKWTVAPIIGDYQDDIQHWLIEPRYPNARIAFTHVVPADREQDRRKRDSDLSHAVIVPNEARAEDGRPPTPWGDQPIVSSAMAPLVGSKPWRDPALAVERIVVQSADAHNGLDARLARAVAPVTAQLAREFARIFRSKHRECRAAMGFRQKTQDEQDREDAIVAALLLLGPEIFGPELALELRESNRMGLEAGAQAEAAESAPDGVDWSDVDVRLKTALTEFGAAHYSGMAETTREIVARAMQGTKTVAEAADKMREAFAAMEEARATELAADESTQLFGAGMQALRDSAGVAQKMWVCRFLPRSRASHKEAHGQTVANDEAFTIGGERAMYPRDPQLSAGNSCGCVCFSVGVSQE